MENAKMKLACAAAIALLAVLSGCTSPGGGAQRNFWVWGWDGLVGTVLMLVTLVLGLGYMASVLLGDEKMRAWVKREVGQLAYSAIILVVAISLVGALDGWLKVVSTIGASAQWQAYVNSGPCCDPSSGSCIGTPSKQPCHIAIANDYLQMLYETARVSSISYMSNYFMFGLLANIGVSAHLLTLEGQPVVSAAPFAGLSAGSDYFMLLFDLSSKAMMLIRAQQIMLDYVNYPFFAVAMSIGLVLRMLYFTRKLGGLLVAIALASYVIFPMFYVLSDAILWGFLGGTASTWQNFGGTYNSVQTPSPFGTQGEINPSGDYNRVFDGSWGLNADYCNSLEPQAAQDRQDFDLFQQNFASNWGQIEGGRFYELYFDFISVGVTGGFGPHGPIGTLATILVLTLFVPFLALMTVLAAVKVFSPLIGGDVEISVLSRLI